MYFHKFTNLPKSLGPRCLQSERGRNIWGVCILFQNKANTWNLLFQNSSNVEIFPFQNTSRILYSNTKYSSWWNLMLTAQIHIYVLRCSNTSYIKQPWVTFALHLTLKLDKIEQCFVFCPGQWKMAKWSEGFQHLCSFKAISSPRGPKGESICCKIQICNRRQIRGKYFLLQPQIVFNFRPQIGADFPSKPDWCFWS